MFYINASTRTKSHAASFPCIFDDNSYFESLLCVSKVINDDLQNIHPIVADI